MRTRQTRNIQIFRFNRKTARVLGQIFKNTKADDFDSELTKFIETKDTAVLKLISMDKTNPTRGGWRLLSKTAVRARFTCRQISKIALVERRQRKLFKASIPFKEYER